MPQRNISQSIKLHSIKMPSKTSLKIGTLTQFRCVGCQEALHTIHNILTTKRHHGEETHVLFVDLIKAFDTIDHEMLFQILAKYGILPALMTVVKKMHKDCRIMFTIGKEECFIEYLNGVYQGEIASSVFFLFLMLAATDRFHNIDPTSRKDD
mmetsp:Transcript_12894/g.18496  ORF Transcript_12894/g.18496 Transcript_12894/m.18496 type:complete len:153 (-) Transcript_12894:163-621(-)